ncbi:MAG TPA: polysaccharide biosynthesis tyrosine autokinase [Candidatus Binatia bacterium]
MNEISPWRIHPIPPKEYVKPEYGHVSEPDEVPLSAYWNMIVKNRKTILTIFFVISAVGTLFSLSATKLYTATATIKIEPQSPRITGGLGEFQPDDSRNQQFDYYPTQFALLQSRPLVARVITELGLESKKSFTAAKIVSPNPISHLTNWIVQIQGLLISSVGPLFKSRGSSDDERFSNAFAEPGNLGLELTVSPSLIDRYLGFITIAPIEKTRLVKVQFTTPSPVLSQVLANAHVQTFLRMSLEGRFGLTQEAREFLEQKKNELRTKLEKAEADLNNFRRGHNVLSVDKGENIVVDRLVDINKQLTAARSQRIEAESLYRTVENKNYQDLAEIMRQGLVQQLKGNITTLEAEKARLGTIFKPDHPRMQELNQQIAAARQAFNSEVASVVSGIKSGYTAALAKERALESEAAKQQQDALNLRELGVQYTVLQEEVNANRSLYESILKRLSETNVSNDLAVSNMQIAERAARPRSPSGPNVPLFILASMMSGLFLGLSAAFLREFVNTSVGTPDDVWRTIGVATLGVVPDLKYLPLGASAHGKQNATRLGQGKRFLPSKIRPGQELTTNHSSLSIISESYRTIRTSLLLSQAEKPPQVILLTSPSPGEGKTATTLNLAIALAQDGRSVLVIDGDMRKGTCHSRLGLRNHRGLSNVLTGGLSLQEGIQETPINGLFLFSYGMTPPNPTELLGSRKMTEILNEVRQRFEFVLIDSPPVIGISDAAVLSVIADGVLLVFSGKTTSSSYARKAVERLEMVRARLLGVVLNAVSLDDPHYSYYRSYSNYYHSPNEFGRPSDSLGLGTDESCDPAGRLSAILKKLGSTSDLRKIFEKSKVEAEQNGGGEFTETERSEEDPSTVTTAIKNVTNFEPIDAAMPCEKFGNPRLQLAGTLPREFLERLVPMVANSIGPMAAIVIRDHIAALGESQDAFPKSRIAELLERIVSEIFDDHLKTQFRKEIAAEIRTLQDI